MTNIQTIIETLILIGVLVVIYLLITRNKGKVRTRLTLVKKYQGDTLHFSKTFKGLFPKTDLIKIFDDPMKTVDYYFDVENKLLRIVAFDEKNCWSNQEYEKLHKDNWECQNIMYIPRM